MNFPRILGGIALLALFATLSVNTFAQCSPTYPAPPCNFQFQWDNQTDCDFEIGFIWDCQGSWLFGGNTTTLPANQSGTGSMPPYWAGCPGEGGCGWVCPWAIDFVQYGHFMGVHSGPNHLNFDFTQFPHASHCCPGQNGVAIDMIGNVLTISCY